MPTGLSDVSLALSVGGLLKEQGTRGLYVSGPLSAESDGIRPWECAADRPDIGSVWFEQYRALVGQESH